MSRKLHPCVTKVPVDAGFRALCAVKMHTNESSSLDVPAGVTQEEGHTGFLIHLPSTVLALIGYISLLINQSINELTC